MSPEVEHTEYEFQDGTARVVADRALFPGEFRFRAKHEVVTHTKHPDRNRDEWSVKLDHQCESWNVSNGRPLYPPDESLNGMIRSMDIFIQEATAVREWLVGEQEHGATG